MSDDFSNLSKRKFIENKTFFDKLKRNKKKDWDEVIHPIHDEVFEVTDCLHCANCCKTTSPIFYQKDIERAAKALRMKPGDFILKYLKMDEDDDYVVKQSPCPFLDAENYCLIYDNRPTACREYPHTNRKRVYQMFDKTLQNTMVCPAVFEIVERFKKLVKS
jgi:hypothetical protein